MKWKCERRGLPEKRGGKIPGNCKLRRREGIKQSLLDITPVSYEKYDDSWDLEDQSKKCERAANCLLASCKCRGESEPISEEKGDLLVHSPLGTVSEMDRRAGTRNAVGAIHTQAILGMGSDSTGRYSDTAAVLNTAQTTASLNHTTDTVSQFHSKARSIQSSRSRDRQVGRIMTLPVQPGLDSTLAVQSSLFSPATGQSTRDTRRPNKTWGSSLVRIGVMLLFMFLSFTVTEGVQDWIESSHLRYITTGILQPRMHS